MVEGTVIDNVKHAPIAGVTVTMQPEKGQPYTATSDSSGAFRIVGLDLGEYIATYEKEGFWPGIRSGIRPSIGGATRLDGELAPAGKIAPTCARSGGQARCQSGSHRARL
jgi:hypothetical protein